MKTYLQKTQIGYTDPVASQLWIQVEKRVEKKEDEQQENATTVEVENEGKSLFWRLFDNSGPQL